MAKKGFGGLSQAGVFANQAWDCATLPSWVKSCTSVQMGQPCCTGLGGQQIEESYKPSCCSACASRPQGEERLCPYSQHFPDHTF
eukprot:3942248-Amphidinium_carterae.1